MLLLISAAVAEAKLQPAEEDLPGTGHVPSPPSM